MDKTNKRVLGILIRSERMKKGYSLRELGEKTNISHTLISNIEKGKLVPNSTTLKDVFRELDLTYYEDKEMHDDFIKKSQTAINYIFTHDYSEARIIIDDLAKIDEKLTYSADGVDYMILKGLFYSYVNERKDSISNVFETYHSLFEFFTDEQKQLVYFIEGMNCLNEQKYNVATTKFHLALSLGRKDRDVFIQQYLMKATVKQYKFIDTYRIGVKVIKEFEDRTIYIRAMQAKLTMVDIFFHIAKNDEVYDLTSNVLRFAKKYNIPELIEECYVYHIEIDIRNREFDEAIALLDQMPNQESDAALLLRFKMSYVLDDKELMLKYYKMLMNSDGIKENKMLSYFIQAQAMSRLTELFDKKKYKDILVWLTQASVKNNDQEMITYSHNYLIQYYHKERSYKKALEIADRLLHFKKLRIDHQF